MRLRLTDQAALAVALARAAARQGPGLGTAASGTHLLAGLAAEPDGVAGLRLRARSTAAAALAEAASPAAGAVEEMLRAAASRNDDRAVTTLELLAVAAADPDLAALLEAHGFDLDELRAPRHEGEPAETFGLGSDAGYDGIAARAVAQVRAAGGGAVELLLALAESVDTLPDPEVLIRRRVAGLRSTPAIDPETQDQPWDAGLDAVVDAARLLKTGDRTTPDDLVLAALVVGGEGAQALLKAEEPA